MLLILCCVRHSGAKLLRSISSILSVADLQTPHGIFKIDLSQFFYRSGPESSTWAFILPFSTSYSPVFFICTSAPGDTVFIQYNLYVMHSIPSCTCV